MNSPIGRQKQMPSSHTTFTGSLLLEPVSEDVDRPWNIPLTRYLPGSLLYRRVRKDLGLSPQNPQHINGCSSWFYPSWLEDWEKHLYMRPFVSTTSRVIGSWPLEDRYMARLPRLIYLPLVTDCPAGVLNVSSEQILRSWNVYTPVEHEAPLGMDLQGTLLLGLF